MRKVRAAVFILSVLAGLSGIFGCRAAEVRSPDPDPAAVKIYLMGDTQKIVDQAPESFLDFMDALRDNVIKDGVSLVLHMGDITENSQDSNWPVAQEGFYKLNGVVPYVLNIGNNDVWQDPDADKFNAYFPLSRYNTQPSFVSNYDRHSNVAHQFNLGGIDWLVISIRYNPTEDILDWAEQLILANPDKKVILVNHEGGSTRALTNAVSRLAKRHENVVFLFAGHSLSRHQLLTGDNGNRIGYVRTCHHDAALDSYVCVVTLDTRTGSASFRYYSPLYGKYWDDPAAPYHHHEKRPQDAPWTWTGFSFTSQAHSGDPN